MGNDSQSGESTERDIMARIRGIKERPRMVFTVMLAGCLSIALTQGFAQLIYTEQFIEWVGLSDIEPRAVQFNGFVGLLAGGGFFGILFKAYRFQIEFSARNYLTFIGFSAIGIIFAANIGFLFAIIPLIIAVVYKYESETLFSGENKSGSEGTGS